MTDTSTAEHWTRGASEAIDPVVSAAEDARSNLDGRAGLTIEAGQKLAEAAESALKWLKKYPSPSGALDGMVGNVLDQRAQGGRHLVSTFRLVESGKDPSPKELRLITEGVDSIVMGVRTLLASLPAEAAIAGRQKPGRNDPCFCGSGKKYKRCHG